MKLNNIVKKFMVVGLLAVGLVAVYFFIVAGIVFVNKMRFPDFFVPLPNGYELVRANNYDVRISGLYDGKQEVDKLIYQINLIDEVVVGKRGRVGSDFKLDTKEIYFCLDTAKNEYREFESEADLLEFLQAKYSINEISLVLPREWYKRIARANDGIKREQVLLGTWGLLHYYDDVNYFTSLLADEVLLNPVSVNIIDGFVVGESKMSANPVRGGNVVEGFFVLNLQMDEKDAFEQEILTGLSKQEFEAILKENGGSDIELLSVAEFIKIQKQAGEF